MIIKNLNKILK